MSFEFWNKNSIGWNWAYIFLIKNLLANGYRHHCSISKLKACLENYVSIEMIMEIQISE
jgi:hypothetical protein